MEITQPNDIFVTTITAPDASLLDLHQSDINASNTGFLGIEDYKKSDFVKKTFTDETGKFNEKAFKDTYLKAADRYQELTDTNAISNMKTELEYDPNSIYAPINSKKRDVSPILTKITNPFQKQIGYTSLFSKDGSNLSVRELAQKSQIWDTAEGRFKDQTAENLGLFGGLISEPLVYAKYEEDGLHLDNDTKRQVRHTKGEYKLNAFNQFYTETLNGREMYGKEIVNYSDTLTKEGSWLNKIDFFDSDDREKSITGTVFKLAATIAPYLLLGGKGKQIWGGLSAAVGLASTLPTFYKMAESIITGENELKNTSSLFKGATTVENTFARFASSKSDYGQQGMFNIEQAGQLVGDVFSQIYQQRAMASLSKIFKSTNLSKAESDEVARFTQKYSQDFMEASQKGLIKDPKAFYKQMVELNPVFKAIGEKQSNMAKSLSLGYMALTTTSDIYGAAILGGYDRRTAGIAGIMAAAGQYGIMQNNFMSKWFLDETVGFNENANRSLLKGAVKPYFDDIEKGVKLMDQNKTLGKLSLKQTISNIKASISNTFDNALDGSEAYWKAAFVEGTEEVTEQAVMDATKGIIDTTTWLGITKRKDNTEGFGGFNNVFSKQGFETYVMSLVGGAVGGPLFKFNENVIDPLRGEVKTKDQKSLVYLVANGYTDDLIKTVEKTRKMGNSNLSPVVTQIEGKDVYMAAEPGKSQADLVADSTIHFIKYLDGILNQEGLKLDDDSVYKKALLNNVLTPLFEESGLHKLVMEDFTNLSATIVDLRTKIDSLSKDDENRSKLESDLLEKRNEMQGFLEGDKYEEYLLEGLFYMNKSIHGPISNLDIDSYTRNTYQKSYNSLDLTGEGLTKSRVDKEYQEFVNTTDLRPYLKTLVSAYKEVQEKFSTPIKAYADNGYSEVRKIVEEKFFNTIGSSKLPEAIKNETFKTFLESVTSTAKKGGLNNIKLNDLANIELSDYLEQQGLLDFSEFVFEDENTTKQEIEHSKKLLNDYASTIPLEELNMPTIQRIVDEVNNERSQAVDKEKNTDTEAQVKFVIAKIKLNKSTKDIKLDQIESNRVAEKLSSTVYNSSETDALGVLLPEATAKKNQHDRNLLGIADANNAIAEAKNILDENTANILDKAEDAKSALEDANLDDYEMMTQSNNIDADAELQIEILNDEFKQLEASFADIKAVEKTYNDIDTKHNQEIEKIDKREDVINLNMKLLFDFLEGEAVLDNELLINLKAMLLPTLTNELDYLGTLIEAKSTNPEYLFEGKLFDGARSIDNFIDESELSVEIKHQLSWKTMKERILTDINNGIGFQEALDNAKKFMIDTIKDSGDDLGADVVSFMKKAINQSLTLVNEGLIRFDNLLNKPRKTNELFDFLRKFETSINGTSPKSIFKIIEDESNSLSRANSINDYIRLGYKFDEVVNAINLLQMVQSVIHGMTNNTIDLANPTGFNQSMVNYLTKHQEGKNAERYAVVDEVNSLHLLSDVQRLIDKLSFIKNLSESNSISKSDEHRKTRKAFAITMLEKMKTAVLDYNGKSILDGISNIHTLSIDDEDKLQEIEMLMYNNFKKLNLTNDQLKDFISQIFKNLNFDKISEMESYGLNHDTKLISDYDYSIYVLTNLGFPANLFNVKLKNILTNENFTFAPFFGQEYAAKVGYAFHSNKELFKSFREAIFEKSNSSIAPYYADGSNLFFLNGISGSGKTSASGQYLVRMILEKDLNARILITAPAKRQIETITDSLKSTLTIKEQESTNMNSITKGEIFNKFLTEGIYSRLIGETKGDKSSNPLVTMDESTGHPIINLNRDLITFNDVKKEDIPTAIFIDETTHFNKMELSVLNMIANKFNITIFTFGDTYQLGASITVGRDTSSANTDQMFTINPMRLKVSIRPSNIHKKDNASQFETIIEKLDQDSKIHYVSQRFKLETDYIKANTPTFTYYQSHNELHGDKIVSSIAIEDLQVMKLALENARLNNKTSKILKIGIVGLESELDDDFKQLLNEVGITADMYNTYSYQHFDEKTVQGVEEEYFIVRDLPYSAKKLPLDYIKSLYTYAGRSLVGSLIEDKKGNIAELGFVNKKENSTNQYPLDIKEITGIKEERIAVLDRLTKGVTLPADEVYIEKKVKKSKKTKNSDTTIDDEIEDINNKFVDPEEIFTNGIINTSIEIDNADNVLKNSEQGGTESIPDNKKTPFTYITHLFYNRFGVANNENGSVSYSRNGIEDLQMLNLQLGETISENLVNGFIKLKNVLSLYLNNETHFKTAISNDTNIVNFLKNSQIVFSKRSLTNSEYANELWNFTRSNNSKNNLVLLGSIYDSEIDSPKRKLNNDTSKHLNDGDTLLRLAIQIDSNGKKFFITLGAMPKYSTLIDPAKGKFDPNSDTAKKYLELEEKINSELTGTTQSSVLPIQEDEKTLKFYTGLRVDPLIDGTDLTLESLSSYGIYFGDVKIFPSDINKIVEIVYGVGLNRVKPDMKEALKINDKETENDSSDLILLRKLSKFKGHPYTTINFTAVEDAENQKVIVLTPKQRGFEKIVEEYTELDKIKDDKEKSVARKAIISKFDGIKMLFSLYQDWEKNGIAGEYTFERFLDSFIENRKNAFTNNGKTELPIYAEDLFGKGEFFDIFKEFIATNKENSWDAFLADKSNPLKDNRYFNIGLLLLGYQKSLGYKVNSKSNLIVDAELTLYNNKFNSILSDDTNLFENKYYYNPVPMGKEGENIPTLTLSGLLQKQYSIKASIEMPRALITLAQTIGGQLNTEIVEEINNTEEIKEDWKEERIDQLVDLMEEISDNTKEQLKVILKEVLIDFKVSKVSENSPIIFEQYNENGDSLVDILDELFDPFGGTQLDLLGDNETNLNIIDEFKKCN